MSTTLTPIITQDGISALIDAKNRGVSARITHVAVGDGHGPYEATADMKALKNELQRAVVAGGEMRGKLQNQLYLNATIKDGGSHIPDVYPIYEMGFFLSDGTLFAIYASPQEKLAEKISGTDFVLAFDLSLTGVDVGEVRIDGDSHLQMPVARDNILVGDNTLKIHTQAAFDKVFNQGKDTVIADNTTIVLSPIQEVSKPFDSGYFRTLAPIERFTDSSAEPGKQVTCQASNHGLQAGDSIMIVRSSAYAGTYHVSQITDNSFDIKASFNADATEAVTALWAADDEDAHTAITGFAKTDAAPANEGTACVSNGHNLKVGDSILITGSDQYNGVYSLATIAEDQFIIDTPFIEADIALGAAGGKGNGEHHTFNGRPAYILKNSIQVGSNVSIIGFNPQDTVVVKNH
ncbi:MAG: phage tail protein, partial [Pseudomonadota bacterium]